MLSYHCCLSYESQSVYVLAKLETFLFVFFFEFSVHAMYFCDKRMHVVHVLATCSARLNDTFCCNKVSTVNVCALL